MTDQLAESTQTAHCATFYGSGLYRAVALAERLLPSGWTIKEVDAGPSLCLLGTKVVWLHGKSAEFEAVEDALHEVAHSWLPDDLENRTHGASFYRKLAEVYGEAFL